MPGGGGAGAWLFGVGANLGVPGDEVKEAKDGDGGNEEAEEEASVHFGIDLDFCAAHLLGWWKIRGKPVRGFFGKKASSLFEDLKIPNETERICLPETPEGF